MIISVEETIRTDVENLFLKEMVIEDNQFLILGECNELDDMIAPEASGLFDDDSSSEEYDDIDIEDILDEDDDEYLFDDFI